MKKTVLTLLLFTTFFASAQIVNIPDASFKAKLIAEGVDTNEDGEIQLSEAQAVTSLNLSYAEIQNSEGIQAFTNLVDLNIRGNFIATLDVSEIITLQTLDAQLNNLASLDVSSNLN